MTVPVEPATLAAMETCLVGVADMTLLSRRVFDAFLAAHPEEARRFISVDAAVLRMTDETFVLLHGLASGAPWAAGTAAHWVDLHRNYGSISTVRYADWTRLCLQELARESEAAWTASQSGWEATAAELNALLAAANASSQGTSQPADQ